MLSQKAKYALKALTVLSKQYGQGPLLIANIAKEKKIPIKFLEAILLQLKNHEFVDSKKGKGGGYYLLQKPSKITLASVLRIVDGPIAMLPCVSLNFYKKCDDCNELECGINKIFCLTRDATLKILEKKTLKDLM
jgi:Rrf2 family protein